MTIKERFDARGFGVTAYARAYGVGHAIVSCVLSGTYNGKQESSDGKTRRIIAQLKKDGVWIGPLPWESKKEK